MTNEMDKLTFNITFTFIEDSCWCMEDGEEGRGRGYCLEEGSPSIRTTGIKALFGVTSILCVLLALGPA